MAIVLVCLAAFACIVWMAKFLWEAAG